MSEHSMVPIVTSQGHPQKDASGYDSAGSLSDPCLIPLTLHTPAILSGFTAAVGLHCSQSMGKSAREKPVQCLGDFLSLAEKVSYLPVVITD